MSIQVHVRGLIPKALVMAATHPGKLPYMRSLQIPQTRALIDAMPMEFPYAQARDV